MKKQTSIQALKPIDQTTAKDTVVVVQSTQPPIAEPLPNGTNVKSNDGSYIWMV